MQKVFQPCDFDKKIAGFFVYWKKIGGPGGDRRFMSGI